VALEQGASARTSVNRAVEVSIHVGLVILLVTACLLILHPFIPMVSWGIIIAVAAYPGFLKLQRVLGGRGVLASYTGIQYTPVESIAASVMPQLTRQSAICCRSPVNVPHLRTGSESRSGGTDTKISLAPMSMPAAFGSNIEPPGCPDRFGCLLRWPLADPGPRRPRTSCCCVFLDMPIPFALATGQAAQTKDSFNRNQFGMLLRTVTTVWCTGLGTTLLIGFESTTIIPAYFRCLSPSSVLPSAGLSHVPFPFGPAHAGVPLLRNWLSDPKMQLA
jgi:hypothetical protein